MNLTRRASIILLALLLLATVPAAARNTAVPTLRILDQNGAPTGTFAAVIEPGARARISLRVAVDSPDPINATIAIANVAAPPNGGLGLAPADAALTAPATWLDLDTGPLDLEPGQPVARTLDIAVPAGTRPGQYVAAITLTATDPVPVPGAEGLGQLPQTTAAVAISVPGEFESGFELGDPTFIATATGGRLQVPVRNTGTAPVHPRGTLTLETADGASTGIPVAMGSVFAGNETVLDLALPASTPTGDARLSLDLTDPDTRATARLANVPLTIPEPPPGARDPDPFSPSPEGSAALSFDQVSVDLEGAPLESIAVEVAIANVGSPVPAATLTLEVMRNGQLVDEVAIAERVALADGVTSFSTTYTPEGGFGSGLVSFRLRLDAIAEDGTATPLLQSGTIAKIDVP